MDENLGICTVNIWLLYFNCGKRIFFTFMQQCKLKCKKVDRSIVWKDINNERCFSLSKFSALTCKTWKFLFTVPVHTH